MGLGLRFESARKEEEEGWSNCYVSLSQQVELVRPQFGHQVTATDFQ